MLFQNEKNKSLINDEVLKIVAARLNLSYETVPVGVSYTNDVFLVKSEKGRSYLKFFTDQFCDEDAGRRELDAAQAIRQLGIPAPEELFFIKADVIVPRNYALLNELEGTQLCKLNDDSAGEITEAVISAIDKLKSIRGSSGFYMHDPRVHNTFITHRGFLEDMMTRGYEHLKNRGFEFDRLKRMFDEWNPPTEQQIYCLCHNDITPKHVLVKGGIISGILDFEWAYFGQVESDYAQWLVSLGINGFEKTLEKSCGMILNKCNPSLLSYYVARQLLIAGVWTHQNVQQPRYTNTCLEKATMIAQNKKITTENLIWKDGSPIK